MNISNLNMIKSIFKEKINRGSGKPQQKEKTTTEWEKIFSNKATDKKLISKIHQQLMYLSLYIYINPNDPIKKWVTEQL